MVASRPLERSGSWRGVLLLVASTVLPGCAYGRDRLLDLTDVVDLRYGFGIGGAGVKLEATDYTGVGAGAGFAYEIGQEWYGRRVQSGYRLFFLHLGIVGIDDMAIDNTADYDSRCYFGYNYRRHRPPEIDRFRFGAQAFGPLLSLGLYINAGQVWDFFAGIAGYDPARDDGVEIGEPLDGCLRIESTRDEDTTNEPSTDDDVPCPRPEAAGPAP